MCLTSCHVSSANIGPRTDPRASGKKGYGSGKQTLRFKANGQAEVEDAPDDLSTYATEKINALLENFMGINDNDLGELCLSAGMLSPGQHWSWSCLTLMCC
ncbi:PDZ domain-containing protein GIPC2 [Portunus trituberculatus]|uniref:PDZ domain-containing protein GIPC2 n=1 Tax=Portunus trituberculatus TaxID=210409 RepID=A0A5B7J7X1_PORTR|nr:PDZ domain-containing protein GIPC2 [Portunus trituberculatus]